MMSLSLAQLILGIPCWMFYTPVILYCTWDAWRKGQLGEYLQMCAIIMLLLGTYSYGMSIPDDADASFTHVAVITLGAVPTVWILRWLGRIQEKKS